MMPGRSDDVASMYCRCAAGVGLVDKTSFRSDRRARCCGGDARKCVKDDSDEGPYHELAEEDVSICRCSRFSTRDRRCPFSVLFARTLTRPRQGWKLHVGFRRQGRPLCEAKQGRELEPLRGVPITREWMEQSRMSWLGGEAAQGARQATRRDVPVRDDDSR